MKAEELNGPMGIYIINNDTIYIADSKNHRIQKWIKSTITYKSCV